MKLHFEACLVAVLMIVAQASAQTREKPGLSAEVVVKTVLAVQAELGVTKSYEVLLMNRSAVPLFVNQCEVTDDTLHKLVITPFALQRWNADAKRWDTIVAHSPDYCRGSRFSTARPIRTPVTPGQKLEAGGDFVGSREPFTFGDRGRFVVFLSAAGDYGDVVFSPEFQIDERRSKPKPQAHSSSQ